MEIFARILQGATSAGASDVHLKVDGPVIFRIGGELVPVEAPPPTAEWLDKVLKNIVPEYLRPQWQQLHEADFAYSSPALGRFRVNVFQQRGQHVVALRLVKAQV